MERFLAEARTIAALDHPNIVRAYSVDNDEADRYYLVMEYVDGMDLQRVVEANGPLDCESVVDCIRQAADGLAHAHARNMIHCDIKPSNLIVNEQGVVKILDMGLARLGGPRKTASGAESSDPKSRSWVRWIIWPPSKRWRRPISTIGPTSTRSAARCIFF